MMQEIALAGPPVPVAILGCNGIGQESDNDLACEGRTLPWLQDVLGEAVWALWGVAYRDVVVLDAENRVTSVYNLTSHDLGVPANYDDLKSRILAAAGAPPP
jgi:hypothetical protein